MVFTKFAKYQICQISNTKHYLIFELPVPQYYFVMVLIVLIIIIAGSGSTVVKDRLSQFACTVTTMHIMCTQRALLVHENLWMVLIPLCKNDLNLSISQTDHYALKQALPQRLNFQHNSTAIVQRLIQNLPQPYLKFQVSLIALSQSDIQILYGLQIDNVFRQCVDSKTEIFKTSLWSMVSILDSLHYFSFQFIKNGSDAM